jgi:hypothetical protein
MKHAITLLTILLLGPVDAFVVLDGASAAQVLDIFPVSAFDKSGAGRCEISSAYSPSDSLWTPGLDEREVFQVELKHEQDKDCSFALRVGKGGQVYSLRGAFGESVPPSWRPSDDKKSPWNDEVWQFVAVCTKYNGLAALQQAGKLPDAAVAQLRNSPYALSYFIHNSGAYIPGTSSLSSLYCPQLAAAIAGGGRAYRTLNWGLVPQVRTIHRSPILYYTQVRDAGDGVIELTWVVHNFSAREDMVFDYLNAPWGGTRMTSLPVHYVSSPAGELLSREALFTKNYDGAVDVRKTGGWNLACVSEAEDSPSLALVYGRDKHLEEESGKSHAGVERCQFAPSLFRDFRAGEPMYRNQWKDWQTRQPNSFRNYDVIEVIPKLRLKPGKSIWYRSFLIVNRKDRAVELAKSLVDKVDYGFIEFAPATTPRLPVFVRNGRVVASGDKPAFELFAHPVPGTQPLFLVENTETGREVITTDPYVFVAREPVRFDIPKEHPACDYFSHAQGYAMDRNHSRWKRLLGYAFVSKPATGHFTRLAERLDAGMVVQPDAYNLDVWVQSEKP